MYKHNFPTTTLEQYNERIFKRKKVRKKNLFLLLILDTIVGRGVCSAVGVVDWAEGNVVISFGHFRISI